MDGNIRMDAVMYMQGAMEDFAKSPRETVGQIVMEIATLGQQGLQINDASVRYDLKSKPGDYSGLHLLSMMHVGIKLFDPSADTGSGLDREYQLAQAMKKMIEGQFGNPPESYLKTILPLIEVARGLLEKGEPLVPIAFVGNFATGKTAQVLLESGNDAEKDRSALGHPHDR